MRTTRQVIATLIAGVALLIAFAAPAFADYWSDTRSTTGAWANCGITTWDTGSVHDRNARISCSLKDTSCDSHEVYIQWWQDGYAKDRLSNNNGCNTTKYVGQTRSRHDPIGTVYWRVCRDKAFDNCSETVAHYPS